MYVYIEFASFRLYSGDMWTIKVNYLEVMQPNYMETGKAGPKHLMLNKTVENQCFQCALF